MPLPRSIRVTPDSTLAHSFDIEARIRTATPADTLKGMFFQRIIEIGERAGLVAEHVGLEAPPSPLRYQIFFDYPVADYFRLVSAVAGVLYPQLVASEAMRRTAVDDFARFTESSVGKVMLAFGGNVRSALARSGTMYAAVLKGAGKVASEVVPEGVRLRYRDFPGPAEVYPIGTIEGCCRYFGADYEIDIDVLSEQDADYLVRLRE
jgi:uncharacterized protein (TIGR02265 family)